MNGEWIQWIQQILIPILVSASVSAIVSYFVVSKTQKKQILRGHITETVQEKYPSLYAGLRNRSKLLDNYLNNPFVEFNFPKLDQIYNTGLEDFIREHHKDLFSAIDSFRDNLLPQFKELHTLKAESVERIFDIWLSHLRSSLPEEDLSRGDIIKRIIENLLTTMNHYNVLPLLLNGQDEEVRFKIEGCILDGTSHIYKEKAKRPFVIKGQAKAVNLGEISQALLDKAKPEIAKIVELHKELKKQNDNKVKERLLPLLKKYISNPI